MSGLRIKNLTWNENTGYAIGPYRIIGRILGIWPLDCDEFSAKIRLLLVIVLQLILDYSLIQEVVNGCGSAAHAVDFIAVFGTTTVSLLKVSVIRIHRKEINCLIESAISDWSMSHDNRSFKIMRRYACFGRIVAIFQLSNACASVLVIVLSAPPTLGETIIEILSDTNLSTTALRNMPMGSGCSVIGMPIFLYLAFYVVRVIQILCLVTSFIGCDAFFFGIIMHLSAQFELLKIGIAQLGKNLDQTNCRIEFVALIERHNHLVSQVNLVEDIFHLMILVQLTSSTLHIGLLGIEILFGLQNADYMELVNPTISISILLLQIYLYSYAGECLTSQVKELRDAAYDCWWYNFSPRLARDVMFMIVRTNHPFYLTAGKIYHMNNESYTTFIKTMATLFSFLKITILG